MSEENIRIVLASRPQGVPTEDNFRLETAPIPDLKEGEILIRTRFLSVDPYMRGRMNAGASYAPGVELDEVMVGGAVGDAVDAQQGDDEAEVGALEQDLADAPGQADGWGARR